VVILQHVDIGNKKEIIDPIMTKYAIDHQEAAGTVLITAMPVVSVIVNNKILKVTFESQTK
jgi:hypothetical protein